MTTARDWDKPTRRLEQLMRLKSFPVAFKLFEDRQAISEIPFIRRMNHKSTMCQLINLARNFDWTVSLDHRIDGHSGLYDRRNLSEHRVDQKQGRCQKV
jgi:uncharacterized protein (DUF169 family)